ncbi:MAG: hypothetical protein WCZ23_07505 [Rhodospirillaceae bacterium]
MSVFVRTRKEHCPPHVHAECPDGWEARFTFSYLNEEVDFWDFPKKPKKTPTTQDLNVVCHAVHQHLVKCRARFWAVVGDICLRNKRIILSSDGAATVSSPRKRGGIQVVEGSYDSARQEVTIHLADGTHQIISP